MTVASDWPKIILKTVFNRLTEQKSLELGVDFESMDESTIFCFRASKDKIDPYEEDEPDSMGDAEIKFSESLGLC